MMDRYRDMQHGNEAWTYSMDTDMQNICEIASWMKKFAKQLGHIHAARTWTCYTAIDMQFEHGNAAQA
jgi:hypothetical protein